MKYEYKRKLYISILFFLLILIIFRAFTITYNGSSQFCVEDRIPVIRLIDNEFEDSLIAIPRTQYKLNYSPVSYINGIFSIFKTCESIFVLQFTLQIIVFDRRKQIITLILQHYEGGKYKHSLSFI